MKQNIAIIGAGVSGLVAALSLEEKGYTTTIYEASNSIGGRVKSDFLDDYILDHGFQVLLSAYPLAQKYLDYKALQLQKFESGAYIFKNGKQYCIGDPTKDVSLLFSTLFSKVGTIGDKLKILKLSNKLKNKSIKNIFASAEVKTIDYLKNFGFSVNIIDSFFRPFFGGIFLETSLHTSSRMFEFVFKMFAEGEAVIPKKGMQAIPNQLASKLKKSKIELNTKVDTVTGNTITFADKTQKTVDFCVITTDPSYFIPNLMSSQLSWNSTQTLYFEVANQTFKRNMIGLVAKENAIINSISFPKTTGTGLNKLLSVSVVKIHQLSEYDLIQKVKAELNFIFNIEPIKYLKTFNIKKSLPVLNNLQYSVSPSETQLTEHTFLAGDVTLYGSLNAAMHSGELVAQAIHEKITGDFLG